MTTALPRAPSGFMPESTDRVKHRPRSSTRSRRSTRVGAQKQAAWYGETRIRGEGANEIGLDSEPPIYTRGRPEACRLVRGNPDQGGGGQRNWAAFRNCVQF